MVSLGVTKSMPRVTMSPNIRLLWVLVVARDGIEPSTFRFSVGLNPINTQHRVRN